MYINSLSRNNLFWTGYINLAKSDFLEGWQRGPLKNRRGDTRANKKYLPQGEELSMEPKLGAWKKGHKVKCRNARLGNHPILPLPAGLWKYPAHPSFQGGRALP